MDYPNFQQELHALNQRISALSQGHVPNQPPPLTGDAFFDQARDLKAHMDSMKARLQKCESSMRQPCGSEMPLPPPGYSREGAPQPHLGSDLFEPPLPPIIPNTDLRYPPPSSAIPMDTSPEAQNHLTLPSGPLFWQLYQNLRTDMQGLDGRVATLEQSVSDLEDRVDGLDPLRFTPPGSAVGSDVGHKSDSGIGDQAKGNAPSAMPELWSGVNAPTSVRPDEKTTNDKSDIYEQRNAYAYIQQRATDRTYTTVQPAPPAPEKDDDFEHMRADVEDMSRTINRMNQSKELHNEIHKLDLRNLNRHVDLKQLIQQIGRDLQLQGWLGSGHPTYSNFHEPSSGLAFRDREIARMDEQLRTVQESMVASEENASQKDAHILELQEELDQARYSLLMKESYCKKSLLMESQREAEMKDQQAQKDAQISQLQTELREARDQLASSERYRQKELLMERRKEDEVKDLQAQIAEQIDALYKWERSYEHKHDSYIRMRAKATACEERLRELSERSERQEGEIDQLNADHDEEKKKLSDFCESQGAVISEQDQVISRGRTLLEEREEVIEKIQRDLRAAVQERDRAKDEGYRAWYELGRTYYEKADGRQTLDNTVDSQKTSDDPRESGIQHNVSVNEEHQYANSAYATAGSETQEQSPRRARRVDSRRPQAFEKRPHGERRAYFWQNTIPESSEPNWDNQYASRSPNSRKQRGRAEGRHRRQHNRPHPPEARNYEDPFVDNLKLADKRKEDFKQDEGVKMKHPVSDQQQRPLGFGPPLPAPVNNPTARRMASETDMRTASSNNRVSARNGLTKHQSMLELPSKRSLQPYVETEDESGREFGGGTV